MVRSCWVALSLLATTSLLACFPDPPRRDDTVDGDQDTAADTQDSFSPDTALPIDTQPAGDVADTDDVDALNVCAGGCAHLDGPCVSGACEHGECVVAPASSGSCDDGNACTTDDHCSAGACVGVAVVCEPASQCHDPGTCDSSTGTCSKPERPWDASCDSGTSYPGFCRNGACKPRMVASDGNRTYLVVHGALRSWWGESLARDGTLTRFDEDVIEVAVGYSAVCIRLVSGTAKCWSSSVAHRIIYAAAIPDEAEALPIGPVIADRLSVDNGCAITATDGKVYCWGGFANSMLGPFAAGNVSLAALATTDPLPFTKRISRIEVGQSHACAVDTSGALYCWGSGDSGALGYASTAARGGAVEDFRVSVPLGPITVADVVVGNGWTCTLSSLGAVRCWGSGLPSHGNGIVFGDNEQPTSAANVQLGGPAIRLDGQASYQGGIKAHICALLEGGGVRCWGSGGPWLGQPDLDAIGDDEEPASKPLVPLPEPAVFVATGQLTGSGVSCAIGESGKLYCWGSADLLGYGDGSDRGGSPGSMPPPPVPFE